jgi:hypothetical protein
MSGREEANDELIAEFTTKKQVICLLHVRMLAFRSTLDILPLRAGSGTNLLK